MDNHRAIQLLQAHIDAEDMPLFSQAAGIGIRAIERVDGLEKELAEAREDAARLKQLYDMAEVVSVPYISIRLDLPEQANWDGTTCLWDKGVFNAAIDAARAREVKG